MLERIASLRQHVMNSPRKVSLERALLYKEASESAQDLPEIVRRARAFAHAVAKLDISIHPGEMIVGGRTAEPRTGVVSARLGIDWLMDELDTISTRSHDPFLITDEQKKICRDVLYPYYHGKDMRSHLDAQLSDHVKDAQKTGIFRLNQTDKGQGHVLPDYSILLNQGIGGMIETLNAKLQPQPKQAPERQSGPENDYWRAALICYKALQHLIDRYAKLAGEQAEQEGDDRRRTELMQIQANLAVVRDKPPETFHQALQLFWLTCVALQIESNASSISIGRFDQFMQPFFKKDIEQDRLGFDQAHLLLSCLWIKMNEVVFIRSEESARYFGGFPTGYNMVLGGILPDGWDGSNQLSYLCLEITNSLRLPQPNLSVRVHQSTPTSFLRKSAELVAKGFGLPQLFSDDAIIESLAQMGICPDDAKNYGIVGCVQLSIPGKMYGMPDVALFNLQKCLELVIHEGHDPVSGKTLPVVLIGNHRQDFADFEQSVLATIRHYIDLACQGANAVDLAQRTFAPVPLLSSLMDGCLESGRDMTEGGTRYNFTGLQQIGIANLADAMLVIKRAVFAEGKLDLPSLRHVLAADYDGFEAIRQDFIQNYAKYGNNLAAVDELASRYLHAFCEAVSEHTNPRGGTFSPGGYTVSAHIPMGQLVGATPDGRKRGSKLADGGLASGSGLDRLGPVSLLKTVSHLDPELLSNGSLLNLRFSASSFDQRDSFDRFFSLVKLFIKLKLIHVQFSVVDAAVLKRAQQHPEQYPELLVRVAGYSAYFKDLGCEVQDDIIDRCQHNMELAEHE